MRQMNKKGVALNELPNVILTLVLVGAIGLAGFITWAALGASTTNAGAISFLGNITSMGANIGSQLPTVGTLIGVGLILGVVIGGLIGVSYMKKQGVF